MKNTITSILATVILSLSIIACGWKPDVTAVPITAPWSTMNLPVKEDAVVWASTPTQLKVVHKDNKKTVLGKYTDALKAAGYTLAKFDDKSEDRYYVDMTKGGETLTIEVYDFQNTGVIIEKK